jgi:hypothetical protein
MLPVVTVHGQQPKHSGWQMVGIKISIKKSSFTRLFSFVVFYALQIVQICL